MARAWGADRWVRLTKEQTWGTFHGTGSTPDGGATVMWVRILDNNAFVLGGDPKRWMVRSADGGNLRVQGGAGRVGVTGNLRTPLYPTQAANLVDWGATPTGSGSARALPSWTADHFDGIEVLRTLGVRVSRMRIRSQDSDNDQIAMVEMDLVGKNQATGITLAEPASSVFPAVRPYLHQDIAGQVSIGGSVITALTELEITFANMLFVRFFEGTTVNRISYVGRDVDATIGYADPVSADRTRFEGQTAVASELGWAIASPASSALFDLQGNTYVLSRAVSRGLSEDQTTRFGIGAFKDASTGADCVATVVSPP
jgi:hypothetical protein